MLVHPAILPDVADPENSKRTENVQIILEQIPAYFSDTLFYDDIEKNNTLIVENYDINFNEYEVHCFLGTVVIEANGNYSWWRNIIQLNNKK